MIRIAHLRYHLDIIQPMHGRGVQDVLSPKFPLRSPQPLVLWLGLILCASWSVSACQAQDKDPKQSLFGESEEPPLIKRLLTPLTDLVPRHDKSPAGDPFIPRGEEAQRQLAAHLQQQSRTASTKNPWEGLASPKQPLDTVTQLPQRTYPWPEPIDSQTNRGYPRPTVNPNPPASREDGTAPLDEIRQASLAGVVKPAEQPIVRPPNPVPAGNRVASSDTASMQFDDLPLAESIMAPVPPQRTTPHPPPTSSAPASVEPQPAAAPPSPLSPPVAVSDTAVDQTPLHKALITLPAGSELPNEPRQLDKASRVLAIVGNQSILAGDVLGRINEVLAPYVDQAPPDELEMQREMLTQQLLPRLVENKLVYTDFLRVVPPDRLPDVEKQASDLFHKDELPKLMKAAGVDTPAAYDATLRKSGSSLLKRRREFMEQEFARTMIAKNVNLNAEVSHGEMLEYYDQHAEDYYQKAQVRWERIMVRFDEFPSRGEAYQAIATMGDEVLIKGTPMAVVARRGSHGPHASEGGQYEWTEQHSVASEKIDRELFSLPIGKPSRIIEDDEGYHIVRVIDRRAAGRRPFAEVQDEIQEKIVMARRSEQIKKYLAKLKKATPVWTVFDQPQDEPGLRVGSPLNAHRRN